MLLSASLPSMVTLTEIIKDKESNKLSVSYVSDKIAEIKSAIAELRNFTEIDRDRILNYIERIELPANGDVNILLKSGQVITIVATENSDFSEGDSVVKPHTTKVACFLKHPCGCARFRRADCISTIQHKLRYLRQRRKLRI